MDADKPKRSGLRIATWSVIAGLAAATVILMFSLGGPIPRAARLQEWQKGWFLPLLFALSVISPYYLLFRIDQSRGDSPRVHWICLVGAIIVFAFGLYTRAYAFSLSLVACQLLMCAVPLGAIRLGASRERAVHAVGVILALAASLGFNCAIAPWAYVPDPDVYFGSAMPADVRQQLEYFYWIWDDPRRVRIAHAGMRGQNPEWDMISRTFLGYSLANVALKHPEEKERALKYLDRVIDSTVKVPWKRFLLPYGLEEPFVRDPSSSVMVDGEVSLMIGLRRLVKDEPDYPYRQLHGELVRRCLDSMQAGPVLCGECYPDECWLWCNPLALTSIKVWDLLEGEDHSAFFRQWGEMAGKKLLDRDTGLIHSAVTLRGAPIHLPEGSTIWIGAYCLLPVLPEFGREQYQRMKELMSGRLFFFAFGREWPKGTRGDWDVDSGFTPFGMGPASTGFALVASKQMGDRDFFARLLSLLNVVGVPQTENGRMRYLSSNLVGDAIFLLGKTTGPAWEEIERRSGKKAVAP